MITGLHKIIKKFILPQFPWVTDYKIININVDVDEEPDGGSLRRHKTKYISVIYYPKTDKTNNFTVTEDFKKIEQLTNELFKMIGDNEYKLFNVAFDTKKSSKDLK